LRQMQERMAQLEDKLAAQTDQLDIAEQRAEEQQQLIQEAGLNDAAAGSALSRFLEQVEFSGVVAASYNWNFNHPRAFATAEANNVYVLNGDDIPGTGATTGGLNVGEYGLTAPWHSNSNTFQLDQLLFSIMKPATVESRGGFGVDLAYGASADALRNSGCGDFDDVFECSGGSNTGDLSFLYQAYVEYLAPIGNGMLVKGGRFETITGAEVFRADQNLNVTRGLLYALQPTSHTGLLISGEVAPGVTLLAGVANDTTNTMADSDSSKAAIGQIAWSGETAGLSVNVISGGDAINPLGDVTNPVVGNNHDRVTIVDVVGTWDPSDRLSVWTNFDYFFYNGTNNGGSNDIDFWGLAAAGRYGITDAMGIGVRGEVVRQHNGNLSADELLLWEVTGTLDYALTDNLKTMLEVRYDRGHFEAFSSDFFFTNKNGINSERDQVLALIQMMYTF
ncbi:MAG: porin, partial [Myxococcales bacterium]|nr:porin [Myxococcales bacterium]